MTTFNIFHTTRVRIGVRDAPHIWGAGEIRDAGERRLFGGLARSEPFVTPHVWGTGEMSTEISATYLRRCGNKHWKSRRIYVALGHDELNSFLVLSFDTTMYHLTRRCKVLRVNQCYGNLPFIAITVSFRKTIIIENISMDISSTQFCQKYYYIRCIKWCKC